MRNTAHGLIVWNNTTDNFDHTELAANWDLIDSYWVGFDSVTALPKKITTVSSLPSSPQAGDLCMLTVSVISGGVSLPAWSLLRYDGAQWLPVGDVNVQNALPSSPFSGEIVVLSAATSQFPAWSVVRYDGLNWNHVGIFGYANTGSGAGNIKGAQINGDVYVNTAARGLVLVDRATGLTYRVYINNSTLTLESVS